jgi:hypothetical protein
MLWLHTAISDKNYSRLFVVNHPGPSTPFLLSLFLSVRQLHGCFVVFRLKKAYSQKRNMLKTGSLNLALLLNFLDSFHDSQSSENISVCIRLWVDEYKGRFHHSARAKNVSVVPYSNGGGPAGN